MVTKTLKRIPKVAGFTLIELMVTVTIVAFLSLLGMPLAREWLDGTRQMRAKSNLLEASGQARGIAMRNPHALPLRGSDGMPLAIAAVLYDKTGRTLCVVKRDASQAWPDGCTGAVWTGHIANAGELTLGVTADDDFACAAYDSRGIQQDSAIGSATCVAPSEGHAVAIKVGSLDGDCADNARRSGCASLL